MVSLRSPLAFLPVAAWALVFLLSAPGAGTAQSVEVGDRVRVQAPALEPGPIQGRVLEVDAEGFLLGRSSTEREAGGPSTGEVEEWRVSFEELTGLERFDGREGHGGMGALIGGSAGLLFGVVTIWSSRCSDGYEGICTLVVAGATAGGALAGLVVGATIRTDRWRPVGIDLLR